MRRFIAYTLASITMILGVGVAFKPIATRMNCDLNYRKGKEIVFKLTERSDGEALKDDSATEYAAIIDNRLQAYGANDYKIVTKGNDTITVTLTANNEDEYNNISKMLTVNSKIELSLTKDDSKAVTDSDGWSWHDNEAYITFSGTTSILVMPIPDKAKDKVKELYEQAKKNEEEKKSNDEPKEIKPSIALWLNKLEDETYQSKDKYPAVAAKMIHDFKTADFYYGTDQAAFQIKFTPASSDKTTVENEYHRALYFKTMLNASTTKYDCTAIHTEIVDAGVEELLIYGDQVKIAASASFIGLMIGFAIISAILAFFYRLGSIAVITTMSVHTFLTFMVFVLLRPLFNISAYVGIIIVSLASLFVGIAYNAYLHEECYKGRNLKKANYEASKKTTMLAIDVSVLFLLAGIITYFVGGTAVSSLGVMLIIGSVINVFINTFILKGLMWLVTNSTYFQHRLKAFNIKSDKVPDLTKEEKQTYFGPFDNKKFTSKQKKISAIVFGVIFAACATGMIAFGATNKSMFNVGSYYATTNEIHFSATFSDTTTPNPISDFADFRSKILDQITNNGNKLKYDENIVTYSYTTVKRVEQDLPKIHYFYVVTVNESDVNSPTYSGGEVSNEPLIDAFSSQLIKTPEYSILANNERTIKESTRYNFNSNEAMIFLASVVSIASMMVYMFIRYRVSRVLTVTFFAIVSSVFTMGYLSLTRLSATPILAIATILTAVMAMMVGMFILNKDKDLIRDERVKDEDTRKAILNKAISMGLVPMSIFTIISAYIGINYFAFNPRVFANLFIASAFAILCTYLLYATLFDNIANYLDMKFMRIKMPKINIKKKKVIAKKTNEPTEAIFFGIND